MYRDLFSLAGKTAVVTGASRGIGLMIAEGLLSFGAKVFVVSRERETIEAAARQLGKQGEVVPVASDLSTLAGIQQLRDDVARCCDRLDILVCNAGAVWSAPFDEFPERGWDKVADLNVKSPFFTVQAFAPLLRAGSTEGSPARVVNVASIDGLHVPLTETYSYTAAKAGLVMLTRMLARTLAPQITVNAIAPGPFVTKLTRERFELEGEKFLAHVPLKRYGTPEDAIGATVYLCSRAGAYVNGVILPVDGGWLGAL